MKNLCLLFTIMLVLTTNAYAQKNNNQSSINKIIITDTEGGMSSSVSVSLEVNKENGQWVSYQTRKKIDIIYKKDGNGNITERKQIAVVDPRVVADFLSSITVIKPEFNWSIFGITPTTLKADLQQNKDPKAPKFDALVKDKTIEEAISALREYYMMDVGMHCTIKIVKNLNDTVKIESYNQNICMLPWNLNGKETYDISISRFMVAAMGKENYPNKSRLQTITLKNDIWEYLDGNRQHGPVYGYRWKYGYPINLSVLKNNFAIIEERVSGVSGRCSLQYKSLPKNIFFDAGINISDTAALYRLIRFRDTVTTSLKAGNFVFKYYNNIPGAKINFLSDWRLNTQYFPVYLLSKKVHHFNEIDRSKIVNFVVESPEGRSQWSVLPDNTLILLDREGNVAGLPQKLLTYVKSNYYDQGHQFILFNADGSMLTK